MLSMSYVTNAFTAAVVACRSSTLLHTVIFICRAKKSRENNLSYLVERAPVFVDDVESSDQCETFYGRVFNRPFVKRRPDQTG